MICLVCRGKADCTHYGVESCRACSSFFRRRVIECREIPQRCDGKCDITTSRRGSCAKCRFQKCLDVGMRISSVYSNLGKYGCLRLSENLFLTNPTTLLEQIQTAYQDLNSRRIMAFNIEGNSSRRFFNYQEMNQVLNTDFKIVMTSLLKFFEAITNPLDTEQKILLKRNFLLKFFLLDSGFLTKGNYELNLPNKNYMTFENINYFYSHENFGIAENAVRIMKSYWHRMGLSLVTDFGKAQIDLQEFLYLTALLYWDYGIQGQSQENLNTCKIMRSRVMKELSEYEMKKESQKDSSLRVGEVLLLLNTVQRALYLIEESRDISIVYNIYGLHYSMYDIMSV
ncbi:hypothetical protein B9Z55_016391 [Caenorhabditis nigoni]|nr:hypothetical protein B9Z55_016391 [Caenorhabditis nigoni]